MARAQLLLPKEHGAYAQLAFPLVTGMALAPPRLSTITLGLAAVAFFLANEPLAVLLGVRGMRLRTQWGPAARIGAGLLLTAGLGLGGAGVALAGSAVWPTLLAPAAAAIALVPMVLAGKQKTLVGETLVVTAFTTLILPLGATSGAPTARTVPAVLVWWTSFLLSILEVHAIKARLKPGRRGGWTRWASPAASGLVVLACLGVAVADYESWGVYALALLPPSGTVLALSVLRVHPRRLKQVGWTLVGANILTLVLLLARSV